MGKWPVWKVDLCRRREPPADFGSGHGVSVVGGGRGLGRRTLGVVLQDLQVHVCVGDDDVELLVVGEEFGCDDLELVFAAAEEHHFVWFFLYLVLVSR